MDYLSAWLFSFGIGAGSLHSDLNKYPLSVPGLVSEISISSCFDKKLLGLKLGFQNNTVDYADWTTAKLVNSEASFNFNKKSISFVIGGELEPLSRIGNFTGLMGLSYVNTAGFGINTSISWRIPNHKKYPKLYYYSKFEIAYWGSDLLDNYIDSKNGFGDYTVSLVLGIQMPVFLNNKHRPQLE